MKRFIALLVALQIGLTPFCSVLAMESTRATTTPGCPSMEETSDLRLTHPTPNLACCESGSTQTTSIQTNGSFDTTPHAVQITTSTHRYPDVCFLSQSIPQQPQHPPDDFERLSQSKRE
jgi:hypothetical protein